MPQTGEVEFALVVQSFVLRRKVLRFFLSLGSRKFYFSLNKRQMGVFVGLAKTPIVVSFCTKRDGQKSIQGMKYVIVSPSSESVLRVSR